VLADNTDLGAVGSAAGTEPARRIGARHHQLRRRVRERLLRPGGPRAGGSNEITDIWVTPFGDITGTTLFDAAGIDALNNNYTFLLTEAMDLLPKFLGGI
jgi:hypothetical protein